MGGMCCLELVLILTKGVNMTKYNSVKDLVYSDLNKRKEAGENVYQLNTSNYCLWVMTNLAHLSTRKVLTTRVERVFRQYKAQYKVIESIASSTN